MAPRAGTYYAAIVENPDDFRGKAVLDVGCGSGILSLFAAQAGARVVYAVEASDMAHHARALAAANPALGARIRVLHGKVEEVELPEKVDVLVSEPMGTLLVNERMIESYLYARDRHLKPGGKMFPRLGRLHLCAFSDEALYGEVAQKSAFFQAPDFYGVDLTALHAPATAGYFGQVRASLLLLVVVVVCARVCWGRGGRG
jgi:histone-arginine methyltransferase CARM1